jgi:hypothetical protein
MTKLAEYTPECSVLQLGLISLASVPHFYSVMYSAQASGLLRESTCCIVTFTLFMVTIQKLSQFQLTYAVPQASQLSCFSCSCKNIVKVMLCTPPLTPSIRSQAASLLVTLFCWINNIILRFG